MGNGLEIKTKKVIYLNGHRLLNDDFDYSYEFKGFIIAYNSNHLVIINHDGDLLVSEEGTVFQVYNYGEYVSIRKNNVMGVYRYDGSLVLPFEFYTAFIYDSKRIDVRRYSSSEYIPLYIS